MNEFDSMYIQGYTAALQDVLKTIDCIQFDLKYHKRKQNHKTYRAIIECMIKNRATLREVPYSFVRCNDSADGGFEVFVQR